MNVQVYVAQSAHAAIPNAKFATVKDDLALIDWENEALIACVRRSHVELDTPRLRACRRWLNVHDYHFLSNRLRIHIATPFIVIRIASRMMIAAAARP